MGLFLCLGRYVASKYGIIDKEKETPLMSGLYNSLSGSLQATLAASLIGGGAGIVDPSSPSWNGWDGTNDGDTTNFFPIGGYGPANVAGFSNTQALIVTNEQTVDDLYGLIVTRSGTSLAGGTVTKISEGSETVGQKASVGFMTASRCLVAYETNSSANRKVALVDVSGSNPSVLDYDVNGNVGSSTAPNLIFRHTDTLAVLLAEGGGSGSGYTIQTVDITADSITMGTQTVLASGGSEGMGVALDSTTGFVVDNVGITHYTISGGGAPTLNGTRLAMSSTAATYIDRTISKISSTRAVVVYRDSTNNKVMAQVITWDGTQIIRGNELVVRSSDTIQVQDNSWSCEVDAANGLVWITWQQLSVDTKGVGSVLRIRANATIELLADEVETFSSIQADHPACSLFPGGNDVFAITVCQDETTSPVKQVATKVIQGTGTGNELPTVGTDWEADITTMSATGDRIDINPPQTSPQGMDTHPSGTKFWTIGTNPDELTEWPLSIAWDLTSVGSPTSFDFTGTNNSFDGQWNGAGTKFYALTDQTATEIQEYAASTPYLASSLTDNSSNYTVTDDANPRAMFLDKAAGLKLFILGQTSDRVYEYTLSTKDDISTAGTSIGSYLFSGELATGDGLTFNPDMTKMYINSTTEVFEYNLTTPGTLAGGVTLVDSFPPAIIGSSALTGLSFRTDNGSALYMTDRTIDVIHEFGVIAT